MTTEKYLYTNAIKCKVCGDLIESEHRHDYKTCSCGAVAVDGGHEYQRVVGEPYNIENMAVWTSNPFWVSNDRETGKKIKIFLNDLTDEHLTNIINTQLYNEDIIKEAERRWEGLHKVKR